MLLLQFLTSFILLVGTVVTAAKHGTIGYGINMYHPWCCTACSDVLTTLYLNCTTFSESSGDHGMSMKLKKRMDMDMEMTGTTSSECYASNKPFQQTLAYCVKTHCDMEGVPYSTQDTCFQGAAAGGLPVDSLEMSLPAIVPTDELPEHEMWLNTTMLVNEATWLIDRRTIEEFERSEQWHVRYSVIIITTSIGIPLLTSLATFLRQKCSTSLSTSKPASYIQSYFSLPALFGTTNSQPLAYNTGYLPSRPLSTFISFYIALNIIFCATPYHSVQPSAWFANPHSEIAAYVANRTGVLSFANIALAILFSTRNNPLLYLSGWTHTSFLTFHRWASRVAIIQAVVHSIVYSIDFVYFRESNVYASEAKLPYLWWGIIATTAMGLMAGLSILPLRKYAYELFLVGHILLAVLTLVGSWYHVDIRFSKKWGYEVWLYIAFAFWGYDRLARLFSVLFYSVGQGVSTVATVVPGTDVISLRVYSKYAWVCGPGSHTFLYFPSLGRFWENHPFTIADWNVEVNPQRTVTSSREESVEQQDVLHEGKSVMRVSEKSVQSDDMREKEARFYIQCYLRAHNGATAKLHHTLLNQAASNISVFTEGPYGGHAASHQSLKSADKILCIAGGIGITWSAGFVNQFSREQLQFRRSQTKGRNGMMPQARSFTLAWSVREEGLLTHVRENLLPHLSVSGLDDGSLTYRFWTTGDKEMHEQDRQENGSKGNGVDLKRTSPSTSSSSADEHEKLVSTITGQRMDVRSIVQDFMEDGKRHVVLVCGPGGLADQIRSEVVTCSQQGFFVDLVEEPFAW